MRKYLSTHSIRPNTHKGSEKEAEREKGEEKEEREEEEGEEKEKEKEKDRKRRNNYRRISYMNISANVFNKILEI